ncbi:MAG: serine/threonine-protein kinase [Candidatus Eremiobacteraeota bacterium]|nr:serine/threonine-protein kinase [Candidatus Eremiobacteraeota bacterium]
MKEEGTTILGRYRVESCLMRTPAGRVLKALDLNGGEPVMVKELMADSALAVTPEEIRERYEREVLALSALKHPGIPRLLYHEASSSACYLVEEFFTGETLDALSMKRNRPFTVKEVVGWGVQLCEMLALFHSHKPEPIIFRDVTPSNIVVSAPGVVKLADFGLSRFFNPLKVKDTFVMGTPGFSPPEQYGSGQSDARSDIYSLGATLYYCLTLRSVDEFPRQVPGPRTHNPLVSGPLDKAVVLCLSREPSRRPQSAEKLSEMLKNLL